MSDATGGGEARVQWGSSLGFILSAIGAAIGFGSISRFPMNVANNGGAVFVLLYAAIMLLVGIPMLIAEFSMGREAQKNTVGTFKTLERNEKTPWRAAGVLYFVASAFLLSWYAIAAGWVMRYLWASLTGAYFDDPGGYLFETVEGGDALFWHALMMIATTLVVISNVSKGIERLNLVLMPLLGVIILGLVIYAATLPNVADGYAFYLQPDFSHLSVGLFAAVIGQTFFSLGIGMGAMMTYASYLPRTASLGKNAVIISVSTLVFATVAGLMVFPLLSTFGLLDTGAAGLDLIFGPLAQAFASMGKPLGLIVGTTFFAATFFAAFTSAVALTEPAIAYVVEEHGVDRKRAAILVCLIIYTLGIGAAFSNRLLALEGGVVTDALIILGGLLIALYVGWFSPAARARERMDEGSGVRWSAFVFPLVRYVMPVALGLLFLFAMLGTPCFLTGGAAGDGLTDTLFGLNVIGCDA